MLTGQIRSKFAFIADTQHSMSVSDAEKLRAWILDAQSAIHQIMTAPAVAQQDLAYNDIIGKYNLIMSRSTERDDATEKSLSGLSSTGERPSDKTGGSPISVQGPPSSPKKAIGAFGVVVLVVIGIALLSG
jgi:hypothetical protein